MNAESHSKIKDLEAIRQVFEKYDVPFYLVYGAVLGFHRDGDFIPHDDDIDLAVIDPIDHKTRKAIGWDLYHLGFEPQQITFNVYGTMEPQEVGYNGDKETGIIVCERGFKFTIFFFKEVECEEHGAEYLCVPKLGALNLIATPKRFFEKPDIIKINKKKYLVPGPVEEYLSFSYFDNWKDTTDRRHSPTYYEMHETGPAFDFSGKNQVVKYD